MKLVISVLLIICSILLISQSVNAQYSIERGVFGNGGGITASTNNSITGTVGQTFVGISSNSNNEYIFRILVCKPNFGWCE